MSREVVVVSGVRTAIGTFGGSLKDTPTTELAAQVVREALQRANTDGKDVGAASGTTANDASANDDDLAVYLHVKHGTGSDYAQALATAMAIYPDLEKGYDVAVKAAYERAAKAAPATASK